MEQEYVVRFEKREDCYFDSKTGLDWSLETHGPIPWQEAVDRCIELGSGWRLPKIEELLSIFDYSRSSTDLPDMKLTYYWSNEEFIKDKNCAWGVYFYDGSVEFGIKTIRHYTRCVRGRPLQYHYYQSI